MRLGIALLLLGLAVAGAPALAQTPPAGATAVPPAGATAAPPLAAGTDPAAGTPVAGASAGQQPAAEPPPAPDFLSSCGPQILMLVVMFAIFYFLLIRPQQKKNKEHQELLKALKRGDRVITASGIFGTITGIDDRVAVLEVSEKVRIKVLRSQLAGKADSMVESPSK